MTATGHAVIGTLIAVKVGNPAIAAPLALASHFLADAFPHWDTGTNEKKKTRTTFLIQSAIDVMLGFAISFAIVKLFFPETSLIYVGIMIIISQLPDWLTAPYLFFDIKKQPFYGVYKLQKMFDNKLDSPWGVINQAAVLIFAVALARYF